MKKTRARPSRARVGRGGPAEDADAVIPRSTLYSLFMQAPAVIAVLRGADHVFELVNAGYQELFPGRPLIGRPVREALQEIEGQGSLEILDQVYTTGQSYVGREARVMLDRRSDGTLNEAFFNFIYQPMRSADERVEGIIVLGFEVTAEVRSRQNGEQRLRESEEMFRLLVESVQDYAIFMLDPNGRITTWNAGARRIKGYERQEIIGRHFSVFYTEEDLRAGKAERLLNLARTKGRIEDEGWRVRKDGTRFWADALISAVHDGSGELRGFAKVTRDVTRRKDAEETARALLVAQEVNRVKDEFVAVISHELRTPLTSIVGWARMLRIGGLDEATTQEALNALERSAQTQVHLIEDLLDDTRITSGKLRLNKRVLELKSVVQSALADLAPAAQAKGLQITVDLECETCSIYGDPIRLQQVVWNIISNATKFTPEGGRISVRMERQASTAVLEVRDSGRGIEPELVAHVFERYRQGDSSSSRKGGIGLGLAITRYLVEQHGGTITPSSEGAGKGATFRIELPLVLQVSQEFAERDPNRDAVLQDLTGIRVLVVEDEADIRDVLATVIARCGGEVRCSATAEDGLQAFHSWNPDVIVCDIALPDTDGCAFLQEVRQHSATPALALTVFGSADEEARVRGCGFDAFRQKPIEPADLAHEISRLAAPPGPVTDPSRAKSGRRSPGSPRASRKAPEPS